MVVCRPAAVIPAQAGIQKRNAAGLYRKKPNPTAVIPAQGGNPATQTQQDFIEKPKTHRPSSAKRNQQPRKTTREIL
ncbi:hypothetical protein E0W58_09900, partial [Neisseria meningitidis]|nr:hypothetical protein [Neisseria meningitidis]